MSVATKKNDGGGPLAADVQFSSPRRCPLYTGRRALPVIGVRAIAQHFEADGGQAQFHLYPLRCGRQASKARWSRRCRTWPGKSGPDSVA